MFTLPGMRALITGITGQDGSYLAELLLSKGYEVWGLIRRSSSFNTGRIEHLYQDPHTEGTKLHLLYGDLTDSTSLLHALEESRPNEIYNLGAQSHVGVSFQIPEYTADVTGLGCQRLLDAVLHWKINRRSGPPIKFYQASSSEMLGDGNWTEHCNLTESAPLAPCSPYGSAKAFAHCTTRTYRESHHLHASTGILFNHTSERRGETFVSRKITRAATRIKLGLQGKLYLGELTSQRDWGYAPDYVDAIWRILQQDQPGDWVIATGIAYSVQDFVEIAFGLLDLDWKAHVVRDERYVRPRDIALLRGNAAKAAAQLDWHPTTSFPQLVEKMIVSDLALALKEANDGSR